MKRIISAISALAVMAGLSASCQKELNNEQAISAGEGTTSSLVVTATIADNGTKVSYAEDESHNLTPTWVLDDKIIGFDGSDNTYGYQVTAVNNGVASLSRITDGEFKGSATADPTDGTTMYMIYAPGKKPSEISDKSLTVSLDSQSEEVVPALMMAQATVSGGSLNLKFENKTAIIGIKNPIMATENTTYTSIKVFVSSEEIEGIDTEVKFEINTSGDLEATYQTPRTISKVVNFISDSDCETSATVYIAACPLSTAADLTFTANNGETFTTSSPKTMEAGKYYYLTPTFYVPK